MIREVARIVGHPEVLRILDEGAFNDSRLGVGTPVKV